MANEPTAKKRATNEGFSLLPNATISLQETQFASVLRNINLIHLQE